MKNVHRILALHGESVPFVEPLGGTAPQHVQPDHRAPAVAPFQQFAQHGRTDAAALHPRVQVEVLQPVGVLGRPQRHAPGERAVHLDHPGVRRDEPVPQPLPYPPRVVPPESLQVRLQHQARNSATASTSPVEAGRTPQSAMIVRLMCRPLGEQPLHQQQGTDEDHRAPENRDTAVATAGRAPRIRRAVAPTPV